MLLDLTKATVATSEGVSAELSVETCVGSDSTQTLRVDYEFKGGGFFSLVLPVTLTLPANYLLSLCLRGDPSKNTVQVKLLDAARENVWWVERRQLEIGKKPQVLLNKKRHFSFAWGKTREPLAQVAYVEVTVQAVAGSSRHGSFYLSGLSFDELAPAVAPPPPVVRASSGQNGSPVVEDGEQLVPWSSGRAQRQWLLLDLQGVREFGGLVIDWDERRFARQYSLQIKTGGGRWQTIDTVSTGRGGRQYHWLPETETTAIRIVMTRPHSTEGYLITRVEIKPLEFASSKNDFWLSIAPDFAPGHLPGYLRGRATYWTTVGVSGAANECLLSEEGVLEMGRHGPSLEPFIWSASQCTLLTWHDGEHSQSLTGGYLPLPVVTRRHAQAGLQLTIEAFAAGQPARSTAYARYRVVNCGKSRHQGSLCLAVRPFQVNPPWQSLRPCGHAPIEQLARTAGGVAVNGHTLCVPLQRETEFLATCLSRGDVSEILSSGRHSGNASQVQDRQGCASGALIYSFDLAPGEAVTCEVAVPLSEQSPVAIDTAGSAELRGETVRSWEEKLSRIQLSCGGEATEDLLEIIDTIKAQVAYILINRQGPAIEPGKRNYLRTWIRDSALICEALMQLGYFEEVREFILWFAPYIFENGKVPCCVDERGADPTPENDSHGEFIHLVNRYFRYTGDESLLRQVFPTIARVVDYINQLRRSTQNREFRLSDKKHLFGLLPPTISHEGYGTPAYSYFDDIFALVGLEAASSLALELKEATLAQKWAQDAAALRHDLETSVQRVLVNRDVEDTDALEFIPGSADLDDFDPTSITIWLELTNLIARFPRALPATFERYWRFFLERQQSFWSDYTPYELRNVGAFVRLNQVDRAHSALRFFMAHRRPQSWRHWAEVVTGDPRFGRYIGDMPHTWVGSDFLRSALALFCYERTDQPGLIIGRGLTPEWLTAGVNLSGLWTAHGRLSITARQDDDKVVYALMGDIKAPLHVAVPTGFSRASVCRQPAAIDDATNTVKVAELPADVVFLRDRRS